MTHLQAKYTNKSFYVGKIDMALIIDDGSLVWVTEDNGQEVRYRSEPQAGFWRNVTSDLFSILPIDDEL